MESVSAQADSGGYCWFMVWLDCACQGNPKKFGAARRFFCSSTVDSARRATMYRLIQRQKITTCRVLRGKLLVPCVELVKLLQTDWR
jgi:hypothetical protein